MGKKRPKGRGGPQRPSLVFPCDLPTWPLIENLLLSVQSVQSTDEMVTIMIKIHDLANISVEPQESAIHRSNPIDLFDDFRYIVDRQFSPQQRQRFLTKTLPCMAKYAICLSELKPSQTSYRQFSLSIQGQEVTMSLDRRFVASVIANAFFFSTFPVRAACLSPSLPDISFGSLFQNVGSCFAQGMRLKNLLNYFDTLNEEEPCGRIIYSRYCNSSHNNNSNSNNNNNNSKLFHSSEVQSSLLALEDNLLEVKGRKPLTPVFVMADARAVDIQNNVSEVILCEFSDHLLLDGETDKILQHPEVLVGLMFNESTRGDEWIKISGILTSRVALPPLTEKNQNQICIIDRTLGQDEDEDLSKEESAHPFMLKELWRYHQCLQKSEAKMSLVIPLLEKGEKSSTQSSKSSNLDRLAEKFSSNRSNLSEQNPIVKEKRQKMGPDQKFTERLKAALARGNTPDEDSLDGDAGNKRSENGGLMMNRARQVEMQVQDTSETRDRDQDSSSDDQSDADISDDSSFSFELGFDLESDYKDLLQEWMLLPDSISEDYEEFQQIRSEQREKILKKFTKIERRRSLSESFSNHSTNLDLLSDGVKCGFSNQDSLKLKKSNSFSLDKIYSSNPISKSEEKSEPGQNTELKPSLWIVSQTSDIDPSRFLVQWLAASLNDIPLVMYQTRLVQFGRNGNTGDEDEEVDDFGADIVASICAGVEERGWDAKQLLHALLEGGKTSLFDDGPQDQSIADNNVQETEGMT